MARILIVDDSNLSRRMLRRILEGAGHEVSEAQDGISALELYFLKKPDLVFLDLNMTGLSGFEVLDNLRKMDANAKVVVATADIQDGTRREALAQGASYFLSKPFGDENVLAAIGKVL